MSEHTGAPGPGPAPAPGSDPVAVRAPGPATGPVATASLPRPKPAGDYVSTTNACKLCTPLGACVAYRGVDGCVPLLHGSQGCSTYIRRYTISHYREPVDIASSNFSEDTAVFGGAENLSRAISNVTSKYDPKVIGIATTCLSETIGEDMDLLTRELQTRAAQRGETLPPIVACSTAAYAGTHVDGFHAAVRTLVATLAEGVRGGADTASGAAPKPAARPLPRRGRAFVDPEPAAPDAAAAGRPPVPAVKPLPRVGRAFVDPTPEASGAPAVEQAPVTPGKPLARRGRAFTFDAPALAAGHVNLLPGFVSPADLRYLLELVTDFGLPIVMVPDYSRSLDAPALETYEKVPQGGTTIDELKSTGSARASIELGRTLAANNDTAAAFLQSEFAVPRHALGTPIGVRETDRLAALLETLSGRELPANHAAERGRLIDAYVDGHKYVSRKRAVVYGEEDLVAGLVSFLAEIGIVPVLAASGGESGALRQAIDAVAPDLADQIQVVGGADFADIGEATKELQPDLIIGSSKGYRIARELQIPLVRVGFPVHDRIGGQRLAHLGYRGAAELYDRIVNTLLEAKQDASPVGFAYL